MNETDPYRDQFLPSASEDHEPPNTPSDEDTSHEENEPTAREPLTTPEFQDLCRALSPLLREIQAAHADDPVENVKDQSPARLEWLHLKRTKGAKSEAIDKLMQLVGLEGAKAFFLRAYATIKIQKRQKLKRIYEYWSTA